MDGEFGQDLSVEFDASQLEAVNELRIADAVELGGGADADNPKRAKLALLLLAADVCEFETALNSFLSCLIKLGFGKEGAAVSLDDFLAAFVALCATFYAGHVGSPLGSSLCGWR